MTGRRRSAVRRGLAGIVAASMLVLAGCSSSLTLDEYIETMEGASDAYVTEAQDRSYEYQSTVEDGVRELIASEAADPLVQATGLVRTETVRYLAYLGDAMSRYRDALAEVDPPGEVAEAHQAFADAVAAVVAGVPATRADVEDAASFEDVERALGGSRLADGQPRWTATCRALEQAVRDLGRGVDLRCVVQPSP